MRSRSRSRLAVLVSSLAIAAVLVTSCSSSDKDAGTKAPADGAKAPADGSTKADAGSEDEWSGKGTGTLVIGDNTYAITGISCTREGDIFNMRGSDDSDRSFGLEFNPALELYGIEFGNPNKDDEAYWLVMMDTPQTDDQGTVAIDNIEFSTVVPGEWGSPMGSFHGSC